MKKVIFLCFCAFVVLGFFSCVSMQEDVYIENFSDNSEISDFEMRFSVLDAKFYEFEYAKNNEQWKVLADSLLSDINRALKEASLKKSVVARLNSIAGCLSFDMGSTSQAKKFYEASVAAFKGDSRALILASRLGIEKDLKEKAKIISEQPLLTLETALIHYDAGEYADAVAKFDEAFLSLDEFYKSAYSKLRENSWNLKDSSGSKNAALLSLEHLTVMQMILIANQNPELLYNYTVGKELSEKELYVKIAGSGLLNPVSQPLSSENAVSKTSPVTRLIAARFLWNLFNQRKNTPQNLTKYSAAYKDKKRSPVPDVKLDSPDFDAALGCVENEIMHLVDGIEFGSENEVTGMEFNESMGKIGK